MFKYAPTPSGLKLHRSNKYLKMIVGPYGSGKSCACAIDVLTSACAQAPAADGVRYARVGVIRSSFPELRGATRRSLLEILPHECGRIAQTGSPLQGFYQIPLPDGTTVSLELELWALATADDTSKILSSNWTFAWINEATGCAPEVYAAVTTRNARFPTGSLGEPTWGGTIMDFNMPTPGTWLDTYIKHPEDNWEVIWQPPAAFKKEDSNGLIYYEVNPEAENLRNLGAFEETDPKSFTAEQKGMRFYRNQIDNNLKLGRYDIIDNQYCMLDVPIIDGKPIFPAFNKAQHVAKQKLTPIKEQDVIVGMDQSGLHPAAVFMQYQQNKWCVLDEIYAEGEGFEVFLHSLLIPMLRDRYSTCPVICAIDPSNERDSALGITPKERLEEAGLTVAPFSTNKPKVRIYAVDALLNKLVGGLLVSPTCDLLIRGFTHEYRYRKIRASGTLGSSAYTPTPEKNDASHLHDALQYAVMYIMADAGIDKDRRDAARQHLIARRSVLASVV